MLRQKSPTNRCELARGDVAFLPSRAAAGPLKLAEKQKTQQACSQQRVASVVFTACAHGTPAAAAALLQDMAAHKMTNFVEVHLAGDYASEAGSNCRLGPRDDIDVSSRPPGPAPRPAGFAGPSSTARMDAYSRHKKYINDYVLTLGEKRVQQYLADCQPQVGKTDHDVLRENHQFVRDPQHDDLSKWEVRMAVKYYSKLFKEYCIADMSRYKTSQIGLRWRTQREVFSGDGQFRCGNQDCREASDLSSYEMNFVYKEGGEKKEALVKLRLCPECGVKLNYRQLKQRDREMKKEAKANKKKAKRRDRKKKDGPDLESVRQDGKGFVSSSSSRCNSDADDALLSQGEQQQLSHERGYPEHADEWHQVCSKSSGKIYFYNIRTGATQWNKPDTHAASGSRVNQPSCVGDVARAHNRADPPAQAAAVAIRKRGRGEDGDNQDNQDDAIAPMLPDSHGSRRDDCQVWQKAPKALVPDDDDDFDEYFKGMFP